MQVDMVVIQKKFQAFLFPVWLKPLVISNPVKACNAGRSLQRSCSSFSTRQ